MHGIGRNLETPMNFENSSIRTRLDLGFGLVVTMMVLIALLATARLNSLGEANDDLIKKEWTKAEAVSLIDTTARANAQRTMELLLATDAAQGATARAAIEVNERAIDGALATLDRLVYRPEGKTMLGALKQACAAYVGSFSQVAAMAAGGRRDAAVQRLNTETLPAIYKLQQAIGELAVFQKSIVVAASAGIHREIVAARQWMLGLAALAVMVAIAAALMLTRSITQPLNQAVAVARAVAAGALTSVIEVRSTNETGQLLRALGTMNASL